MAFSNILKSIASAEYVVAVLSVAMATGLRLALDPVIGTHLPFLPFVAAVLLSGSMGGRKPALAATVLSVITVWYFFLEPHYSFALADPSAGVGLGVFAVVGIAIALFATPDGELSRRDAAADAELEMAAIARSAQVRRLGTVAGGALALGLLAAFLWTGFRRSTGAERLVEHTYQVMSAASSVRSSIENAIDAQRGYAMAGNDRYIESYQSAMASERQAEEALRRLVADNPVQQSRIAEFEQLVQSGLVPLSSVSSQTAGDSGLLIERLRGVLDSVDQEERRLLHVRTMAASQAESRNRWVLGLGSGSLLLLLLLASAAIERGIRERGLAEQLLARQARLIDLSHDAIITADGNRVITGWNAGACEMYGWTEREAVGKVLPELLGTRSPIVVSERNRILARDGRWFGELAQITSTGTEIVVESRQVLNRDRAGRPSAYLEINRDITERKHTGEVLRQSEEKFAQAFSTNPAATALARLEDGLILDVNRAWLATMGYSREEAVGASSLRLGLWASPEERARFVEELKAKGSVQGFEVTQPRKSGEPVTLLLSAAVLTIAGEKVILSASVDISARKQAEEALRESQAQLEAALASMTDAVFISDIQGRFIHFNDAFATFHKFHDKAECAKTFVQYPEILDVFLPDGAPAPVDCWAVPRALRGERATAAEYSLRRKDTGESWVGSYSFGPIRGQDGGIVGSVVVARDITESKRAEEEIRRLNAGLEQRVHDRTAQLEASNKELEAFAYSVSHDLRAPLRGIDGWSLALMEDYSGRLDEKGRRYLERVRSESQRMGHLIDDLLQLSRITRAEMNCDSVDLSEVAKSIAGRLGEVHPQRCLEFVIEPGLRAFADARLMGIALTNLMENAVKFTGPRERARIEFSSAASNGNTAFSVRDNGVGFDMAYAGTLFGAFQRLHSEAEFPGTGIGLATVRRVIHRHGGRIWAEAEPDRGAAFYFTLGAGL